VKRTGAALVVKALEAEGIPFTFGIPGTHNIELYDALAAAEKVRPILVTDEQSASFMADGLTHEPRCNPRTRENVPACRLRLWNICLPWFVLIKK